MKKDIIFYLNKYIPDGFIILDVIESKTSTYFYITNEKFQGCEMSEDDPNLFKFRVSNHDAMCSRSFAYADVVLNFFHESGYEINIDMFSHSSYEEFTYEPKDVKLTDDTFYTQDQNWVARQIAIYFCSKIY